jgi:hypothetical protein
MHIYEAYEGYISLSDISYLGRLDSTITPFGNAINF